jgi:hypothetical protein
VGSEVELGIRSNNLLRVTSGVDILFWSDFRSELFIVNILPSLQIIVFLCNLIEFELVVDDKITLTLTLAHATTLKIILCLSLRFINVSKERFLE